MKLLDWFKRKYWSINWDSIYVISLFAVCVAVLIWVMVEISNKLEDSHDMRNKCISLIKDKDLKENEILQLIEECKDF